jgi:large subunit ribosomal protein L20|tara:strand:+ start:5728 stop:5985 length:258 start_codon:yes stop_codon:yes gene_type:complete
MHALRYSYEHRKERKGDMRRLWNIRINAAAREHGITYSSLIHGMKIAGIQIDRKILSDLAIQNPEAFTEIVSVVKVTMESNQTAA